MAKGKAWAVYVEGELFAVCMTRKNAREMIWDKSTDKIIPVLITPIERKKRK